MKDEACIFCKIANGEIPSKTIYEDEEFRIILDLGPATKGHALILPKEHYADLFQLPEETAKKAIVLAKKLGSQMVDKLHADGFNLVQNNGEAAGQTVFHFHMHLIPRYKDDNQKIGWVPGKPEEKELEEIQKQIMC
ncbi:MAG: HIT family protein [Roseburia sp.]|nr:HIT family protein [Roseburia sp.]MCM1279302.1 HIT family protein [Robinsoniella sp.]